MVYSLFRRSIYLKAPSLLIIIKWVFKYLFTYPLRSDRSTLDGATYPLNNWGQMDMIPQLTTEWLSKVSKTNKNIFFFVAGCSD